MYVLYVCRCHTLCMYVDMYEGKGSLLMDNRTVRVGVSRDTLYVNIYWKLDVAEDIMRRISAVEEFTLLAAEINS